MNINQRPYDLHLKDSAANAACCIDKIAGPLDGGSAMLPDHDIDGKHRPGNNLWDIGAHEVR